MSVLSYFNAFFKSLLRFLPTFSLFKSTNPTNALKEKELGNEAYKNRDFGIAHQHYDRGIELEPNNIILLMNKAAVFFEENKFDECIQFCKKAIEIGSENNSHIKLIGKAFARIGNAYLKQEKLTEALQYFEKSISKCFDDQLVQKYEELKKKMKEESRIDLETTSKENTIQIDRHCAFCLKFLPSGTSKLCGKCHRRAYCSRECQIADWESGIGSQGHKNWCHLECGEEDIDWEVKPSPGKGLGVFAKRPIPAKYRVMVDAFRHIDHPAIDDLRPIGGTRQQKINLNVIGTIIGDQEIRIISLRVSRINHDCYPNAGACSDRRHNVYLIFTERDIQSGEEITISYCPHTDIFLGRGWPSLKRTTLLQTKWGVFCKEDCVCKQKPVLMAIEECFWLRQAIEEYVKKRNGKEAMKYAKKLLSKIDAIYPLAFTMFGVYYQCFLAAILSRSTLEEAKEYGRLAYESMCSYRHPLSSEVEKYKALIDPGNYDGYLCFDQFITRF